MGEQDIKRLFLYEHELEIKEGDEIVGKVYQRILNNADLERARREGLRESAALRKRLKDEDSADYEIYISSALDMDKELLIAAIIAMELRDIRDNAYQVAQKEISLPKRPRDDNLEKMEKYQEKMDSYNADIMKRTVKLLSEQTKKRSEELEKEEDIEKLRKLYVSSSIRSLCSAKMLEMFHLWTIFLGTYKDKNCKKRFFNSFNELLNIATELQRQLIDGYFLLEIDKLTLKK